MRARASDPPPASVGALDRLVSALENAGVQFDVEGAHLDRDATIKAQVAEEIDQGAAASHPPPRLSWTRSPISSSQRSSISRKDFVSVGPAVLAPAISKLPAAERDDA